MGKNGILGKKYGKVVDRDTTSRIGEKSAAQIKKKEASKLKRATKDEIKKTDADTVVESEIPIELQALLLNIFRDAFPVVLSSSSLQSLLQEVKKALYERDFARAFGREEFLEAYSIRWSPSRALCYQSILVGLQSHLAEISPACQKTREWLSSDSTLDVESSGTLNVVCFGGGAAEVVAFSGFLRFLLDSSPERTDPEVSEELEKLSLRDNAQADIPEKLPPSNGHSSNTQLLPQINLRLLDTAQWQKVVDKLQDTLTTPPALPKYASSSAKAANDALVAKDDFNTTFIQEDVLAMSESRLGEVAGGQPMLLTLLFTLNELYTSSIGKTTTFLLNLTAAARSGTLLLVVDSPGSYSETTVGNEAKKYPMHWLLDHTLLETKKSRDKESTSDWVKLVSEDSTWFRLTEGLQYPIPLENMRYQMHLYRRV